MFDPARDRRRFYRCSSRCLIHYVTVELDLKLYLQRFLKLRKRKYQFLCSVQCLIRPGIEEDSTVAVADALFTMSLLN